MWLWVMADVGSPNLPSGSFSLLTTGKDCKWQHDKIMQNNNTYE
jgi:hypothetical protein